VATEVVVPILGATVKNGKILDWLKSGGDWVEKEGVSLAGVEGSGVRVRVMRSDVEGSVNV
jgi:pyruvate/2-oxoglutarate dehydrogenase complex dihydrolipoamide acyltransferase (E2) component